MDLLQLVKEHYIQQHISQNFIESLPEKWINTIRKYKLYHLAKWSEYRGIHEEEASYSLNWAVEHGYIDICEWLDENTFYTFDCNFDNHPQVLAAKGGHLEMMKWLTTKAIPPNYSAFSAAKAGGHLHILDWLLQFFVKNE